MIAFPSLLGSTQSSIYLPTHPAVETKPGDPQWMRCSLPGPPTYVRISRRDGRGHAGVGDNASLASRKGHASGLGSGNRGGDALPLSRDPRFGSSGRAGAAVVTGAAVPVLATRDAGLGVRVIASPVALPRQAGSDDTTGRVWIARRPGRCVVRKAWQKRGPTQKPKSKTTQERKLGPLWADSDDDGVWLLDRHGLAHCPLGPVGISW